MAEEHRIHSDEAASRDALDRDKFADALAETAATCDTPLVIGIYGDWGIGKTTLMRLIKQKLEAKEGIRNIWFDPWQHQFNENPALSLLHKMIDDFKMKTAAKKILNVIAGAFGSALTKATINVSPEDIERLGKMYEADRFETREAQVRLQEQFRKLIKQAQETGDGNKRIVFFIDDLDRCVPEQVMSMLEALKLYLNVEGCVYFLGVNHKKVAKIIGEKFQDGEEDYLDKIVQLPFIIPPIADHAIDGYIDSLLDHSEEFLKCKDILVKGLGDNPRDVKRFVNILTLNNRLAQGMTIANYRTEILALLLLIQYRKPALYDRIALGKITLQTLQDKTKEDEYKEYLAGDDRLDQALFCIEIPPDIVIDDYIYLTKLSSLAEEPNKKLDIQKILIDHRKWLNSGGREGNRANLSGANLSGAYFVGADFSEVDFSEVDFSRANLIKANLIRAILVRAILVRANLSAANLSEADLSGANLSGAYLRGTNLRGTNLRAANLSAADLSGTNLSGTNLSGANLSAADLSGANLSGANLSGAYFVGADFSEANLRGADLSGADLSDVDLSGAKVSATELCVTKSLFGSKVGEILLKELRKKCPALLNLAQ